ncbi:thiolase C-terminal domain-containing protein [Cupriavidus basilensis]
MCSPIGDGAAALVLVSEKKAKEIGLRKRVRVLSSVAATGWDYQDGEEKLVPYTVRNAYEKAAIEPGDIDVVELHDAGAPAELIYYEYLGLARPGAGIELIESGATELGGRIPVNPPVDCFEKGIPSVLLDALNSLSYSISYWDVRKLARSTARVLPSQKMVGAGLATTQRPSWYLFCREKTNETPRGDHPRCDPPQGIRNSRFCRIDI